MSAPKVTQPVSVADAIRAAVLDAVWHGKDEPDMLVRGEVIEQLRAALPQAEAVAALVEAAEQSLPFLDLRLKRSGVAEGAAAHDALCAALRRVRGQS